MDGIVWTATNNKLQINKTTLITASIWNTDVVDNIKETAPAKASAKGDIFAATGANAIAAVASRGDGWSPVFYSPAAAGVAASPMGVTLVSAPYTLFENTSDAQTAATFTIPGGWMTTDNSLRYESVFRITNAKGSEGGVTISNNFGTASINASATSDFNTFVTGTSDNYIMSDARVLAYGAATQFMTNVIYGYRDGIVYNPTVRSPSYGTEDSTTDKVASITIQMDASSSNFQVHCLLAKITYFPAGTMTT